MNHATHLNQADRRSEILGPPRPPSPCPAASAGAWPEPEALPWQEALPDPLVMFDGTPVRTPVQWREHRRPQLLSLFEQYMYGAAPGLFEAACRVHGVRVCGEWKFRIPFDDPRCLNLFRKAGERRCSVVLHLDVPYLNDADSGKPTYQPDWYGGTVDNLERALQACPDTNFIGHAPGFWREITGDADLATTPYPTGPVAPGGRLYRLFDTYPNLFADLSAGSALNALKRDPEHARAFLTRYASRLLSPACHLPICRLASHFLKDAAP